MSKSLKIISISLIALFACLYTCDNQDTIKLLKSSEKKLEKKLKDSEDRVSDLNAKYNNALDSIKAIQSKKDTIIKYRDTNRTKSNKIIEEAKSVSEEEADSILDDRFETRKENLIYTLEHDSLKLEHRSLVEINKANQQELLLSSKMNEVNRSIIKEQVDQLSLSEDIIELKDFAIKSEKRRARRNLFKGVGVGIAVGAVGILLLQ